MSAASNSPGPGDEKRSAGPESPKVPRGSDRVPRLQVRGLILLALVLVFFALMRADWHRLFAHGWWRIF